MTYISRRIQSQTRKYIGMKKGSTGGGGRGSTWCENCCISASLINMDISPVLRRQVTRFMTVFFHQTTSPGPVNHRKSFEFRVHHLLYFPSYCRGANTPGILYSGESTNTGYKKILLVTYGDEKFRGTVSLL